MSRRTNRKMRQRQTDGVIHTAIQHHIALVRIGQAATLNRAIASQGCLICGCRDGDGMAWKHQRRRKSERHWRTQHYWLCAIHNADLPSDEEIARRIDEKEATNA